MGEPGIVTSPATDVCLLPLDECLADTCSIWVWPLPFESRVYLHDALVRSPFILDSFMSFFVSFNTTLEPVENVGDAGLLVASCGDIRCCSRVDSIIKEFLSLLFEYEDADEE